MKEENIDFGKWFAQVRYESGYKSQRKLAKVSSIANSTIARIESGSQKPEPETLRQLAPFISNTTYEEMLERAGYLTDKYNTQKPTSTDLEKLLKESSVHFDGVPLDEEEKQSVLNFIKLAIDTIRKNKPSR